MFYTDKKKVLSKNELEKIYNEACLMYNSNEKEKIEESFNLFQKAALYNYPDALFQCGYILENGIGIETDIEQAITYYKKASSLGQSEAKYNLAVIYYNMKNVQSIERSRELFESLPHSEFPKSFYYLGKIASKGYCEEPNQELAFDYYSKGAELHEISSILKCAEMYYIGMGTKQNSNQSLLLFIQGSCQKDAESLYQLGKAMLLGDGCPKDTAGGWANIEKSGEMGYIKAKLEYSVYLCGMGDRKHAEEGLKILETLLNYGYPKVNYYYGLYKLKYYGCEDEQINDGINELYRSITMNYLPAFCELAKYHIETGNLNDGISLYESIVKKRYAPGCLEYGLYLLNNVKENLEIKKIISCLEIASSSGIHEASFELGQIYKEGKIIKKDKKQSIYYFKISKEQGSKEVICHLAEMYLNLETNDRINEAIELLNEGIMYGETSCMIMLADYYNNSRNEDDSIKARDLYYKAAQLGNIHGIKMYATYCYQGSGGEINYEEGRKWFKQGAKYGNLECIFNFAYFCEKGYGCERNIEKASKYYLIAIKQDYIPAMVNLGRIYEEELEGDDNLLQGLEYYIRAGELGDGIALFNAGLLIKRINAENEAQSIEFFERAALLGHIESKYNVGIEYIKTNDPEKLRICRQYLQECYENRLLIAYSLYSYLIVNGIGGPILEEKGRIISEEGAIRGDKKCMMQLSNYMMEGIGGIVDEESSNYWKEQYNSDEREKVKKDVKRDDDFQITSDEEEEEEEGEKWYCTIT